jgi:hypothetical protein
MLVQGIDFTNGSAFWDVVDISKGEQIRLSRRCSSDEVLELFAPGSEKQT